MTSCLARNDYNIIFSFFILVIVNNFFSTNSKLFSKVIIQLLVILIIADLLWMFIQMPLLSHDNLTTNVYWNSLSSIHTLIKCLAFLELVIKGLILAYLGIDFKQKNPQEIRKLKF